MVEKLTDVLTRMAGRTVGSDPNVKTRSFAGSTGILKIVDGVIHIVDGKITSSITTDDILGILEGDLKKEFKQLLKRYEKERKINPNG